jgi:hypothetical protein
MDIVFDDDNARVLRSVHDEPVSAVEDDVVAVACIECHQGVTTTNCLGPSGEMISKFELRVVGDGVEIVVPVDQAGQTLLDDVEERPRTWDRSRFAPWLLRELVQVNEEPTSRLCRRTTKLSYPDPGIKLWSDVGSEARR